jgi:hypothetical protein
MSRIRCNKRVFRKPKYTGLPPYARDCFKNAVYQTTFGPRCTRHTEQAERLTANKIASEGQVERSRVMAG